MNELTEKARKGLSKARCLPQLARYFGAEWVRYRLGYAVRIKSGMLARGIARYAWEDRALETWVHGDVPIAPAAYRSWRVTNGGRHFLPAAGAGGKTWIEESEALLDEVNRVLGGEWTHFSRYRAKLGFPPDWHREPAVGRRVPADKHWSRIADRRYGDTKLVWEPSRFGVVYLLMRAYAMTSDERYVEAFWRLVEDWRRSNPPQLGVNWKCGQEASYRLRAWCAGLYYFWDSAATSPERVWMLAAMVAAHADRIEKNIAYARSQKNIHAISEGVGLWTVGLLFREFARSAVWLELGRTVIEQEVRRQVYGDGGYAMSSLNYHRALLHNLLWALRLGEVNDAWLSAEVYARFDKATRFLMEVTDSISGQAPNYGDNDGTLVLPLSPCGYGDFRPVLQAAYFLLTKEQLFPKGPWDNDLFWLFGSKAAARGDAPRGGGDWRDRAGSGLGESGYHTLQGKQTWVMIRCACYRDRPSHADQLHVDLWWRGINVACDAGTYSYHPRLGKRYQLRRTLAHNTMTVDGLDQMTDVGRFLWLDWAVGQVRRQAVRSANGLLEYWEGEHDGYTRLVRPVNHRRALVRVGAEHWLILDRLESEAEHEYRLHWLLADTEGRPAWVRSSAFRRFGRGRTDGSSSPPEGGTPNRRPPEGGTPNEWVLEEGGGGPFQKLVLQTAAGRYHAQAGLLEGEATYSLVRAEQESGRGWRCPSYFHLEPAWSWAISVRRSEAGYWSLFGPDACEVTTSAGGVVIRARGWEAMVEFASDSQGMLVGCVTLSGREETRLEP